MNQKPRRPGAAKPSTQAGANSPVADPARWAAYRVLEQIAQGVGWRQAWDLAADELGRDSLDRHFAQELASGCLRLQNRHDYHIDSFLKGDVQKLEIPVLLILRLGAYQLLEMDRVPDHAAIHTSVEMAKRLRPATSGLVNAVLRKIQSQPCKYPDVHADPVAALSVIQSHPRWMVERWLALFGYDMTEALCVYNNQRPDLCLRANSLKTSREELLEKIETATAGKWSRDSVRLPRGRYSDVASMVMAGWASVQDESATLVVELARPKPGSRWLELCASPGGKACHLAELVGSKGEVVALDVSPEKLERILENKRRLELAHLTPRVADGRKFSETPFDGVLVDAPCSGLGVLSRRPDSRWRKFPEDLLRLKTLQLELLENAARLVNEGGQLVYSVCSFEPEETTEVVGVFQQRHPEFSPVVDLECGSLQTSPGIVYFYPHEHQVDGGFVSLWRRRGR